MVTHRERSKAISDVAGHMLHSFCAGNHGFKGIVGIYLINSSLQVILIHGTLMKTIFLPLFFAFTSSFSYNTNKATTSTTLKKNKQKKLA